MYRVTSPSHSDEPVDEYVERNRQIYIFRTRMESDRDYNPYLLCLTKHLRAIRPKTTTSTL